jgi:hypothetical protein
MISVSRHLRLTVWTLLACAGLSASAVMGAETLPFSADIVTRRDGASVRLGRLGVRDGKVRIETSEFPDGFFLVDAAAATRTAYFVRPAARVYMDARQSSRLTRLFVPVDPDAPCLQWQGMARLAGLSGEGEWSCERTGDEVIDGRDAIAFRVLSGTGQSLVAWIDRTRQFPVRIKTDDDVLVTLEAIKDEPQAASAFALPENYRKFNPEALVDRIKQSDVWVAKPDEPSHP